MFSGGAEGAEALIVSVDAQLKASKWVDHRARCQCSLMPEQRWKSTYNPSLQANIFLHCPFPCNSPASASPSFSKESPHRFIFCSIVWRSFEIHPRFVEMGMVIRSAHRLLLFFDVEFRVSRLWSIVKIGQRVWFRYDGRNSYECTRGITDSRFATCQIFITARRVDTICKRNSFY